ncbi:MAG: 1-acyl-sn-glycerol-3-phosphate acyltransferase [Alphaproteobacteria bacterium]|nr:1-acyl-sn-glycerol-3-phosphate acyltransferase [Alphaproteobacteria bacterium]MBO6629697.1 1-acyl-sn-glycerol-3-phosphate acyltransferase [Alphaproteobacteria bacterium]MDF1625831.1 lysophospholipid acyltransferase family protein [Parvibaculaceae bacterium]
MAKLDYYWRLIATGLSFTTFGLGGIAIGFVLFPLIHLLTWNTRRAQTRCQFVVHLSFKLFIWLMKSLGILTYSISGMEHLSDGKPGIVIANHPSLIDVVFVVSCVPNALCIVKRAAWSNPFMMGVMWATGYIPNTDPDQLISMCAERVRGTEKLVVFPEGTRTTPGKPLKLKRGSATIITKSGVPFTPVTITIRPTTLTKAEKWYQIPPRRMHVRMDAAAPVDPQPHILAEESQSLANRRMNKIIGKILLEGIEQHERAY